MSRRLLLLGIVFGTVLPLTCYAFANVEVGATVQNVEMPALKGGKGWLLSKEKANVFIFFKPNHEHSRTTLLEMAKCEKEFAGKSVNWVGVVSDHFPKEEVQKAVAESGLQAPILIDEQDTLYGTLGVALHPVIGITDAKHKLVAYQPFQKINYCDIIRARIQFVLGEITEAQLDEQVNPPAAKQGGDSAVARRYLKLGEKQLKAGEADKAIATAQKSLEKDPNLAAAHGLLGAALAAKKDCPAALKAVEKALSIDAQDPMALEGKKACAEAK